MLKQIYWLMGDDFICHERKNEIIQEIEKERKQVETVHVDDPSADLFLAKLRETSLFGPQTKVLVYTGDFPDFKKTKKYLENMPADSFVIFIGGDNLSEANAFRKKFKPLIESFPKIVQKNGYPNKSVIPNAVEIIKRFTKTDFHTNMYLYLLEKLGYDYGLCISELRKMMIVHPDGNIEQEDVDRLICEKCCTNFEDIILSLSQKDIATSFVIINNLFQSANFNELFIPFLNKIYNHFNFYMYCKVSLENHDGFGEDFILDVIENMKKSNEIVNEKSIRGKFYYNRDYIKLANISEINFILSSINDTSEKYLNGVYKIEYLTKQLITKICLAC